MKTTYLLIICILICRTSMAQVEYDNRFYEEILKECFYDTKTLEEIGITGKVKNIKLYRR